MYWIDLTQGGTQAGVASGRLIQEALVRPDYGAIQSKYIVGLRGTFRFQLIVWGVVAALESYEVLWVAVVPYGLVIRVGLVIGADEGLACRS